MGGIALLSIGLKELWGMSDEGVHVKGKEKEQEEKLGSVNTPFINEGKGSTLA